jgi:hypothetical protein
VHRLLEQQGAPALPQAAHTEVVRPGVLVVQARSKVAQVLPVANVLVGQQGSPALPQVQRPDLHVP